jgi:adenosyl cobinamide kinase/adenosyl cobinamide phosphate guanylyltransferase
MILVTGGSFQGKLDYVKEHFHLAGDDVADGGACALEAAFDKPVLDRLHRLAERLLDAGTEPLDAVREGVLRNPGIILICDEVGCGVVPMEAKDRALRETVGRMQCMAAKMADEVYRVSCGLAAKIK